MTAMSIHRSTLPRPLRLLLAVASLLALAAILAGCSAGAGDYTEAGADPGGELAPEEAPADGGTDSAAPDADRALVVTGDMYMTVEDPIAAADEATDIVHRAGGRIDARDEVAADEHDGGSATLAMRIPTDDLDATLDKIRALGTVDELRTNAVDVTNEVRDLDARISTLKASTARIEGLLAEATSISDIITLENELATRQAELESLEARQRGLDDQVSLSTITLSLTTEPVVIVEDEGPSTFLDGLESGWNGLTAFVSWFLVVLGVLLPWLVLFALVGLAVLWIVRGSKKRNARKATATLAPTHVEAPPSPPAAKK
jgi:hypothetical protein